jgi:hypothetical protein
MPRFGTRSVAGFSTARCLPPSHYKDDPIQKVQYPVENNTRQKKSQTSLDIFVVFLSYPRLLMDNLELCAGFATIYIKML